MERESPAAAVSGMLDRAVGSGLAVGWSGLAVGGGASGLSWTAGRAAVGGGPATPDLLYDLASLTKPLATTTLLLLARRDGLDLEAPLGALLPPLDASPWREVRVWQCATHTGGFPPWEPLYAGGARTAAGYLEALAAVAPSAAPGTTVAYSCLGYIALGLALERATGASLAELFRELVATPLGVAGELTFAPPADVAVAGGQAQPFVESRLLAERHLAGSPPAPLEGVRSCDDGNARGLGGAAGNAGLFGTASAVARLAAEYMEGGGELLSADEADLASRCRTVGLGQARGLGWQLAATPGCSAGPGLPAEALGHTGFTGTSLWIDRAAARIYVLLGNRLHPGGRTPDLHPLRRRFHALAAQVLEKRGRGR